MDKRIKFLLMSIGVFLLVAIVSTSYAFFTISNKEGTESVVTSGTMGLHLEDGPEVGLENAIPGSSVTKIFYVENTGNVDTAYDIYLSEVVNTFVDKTDLVYTLTSSDGGYSTSGQVQAPSASAKIVDSKPISVSGIHHYTLVLTFLEKNENQDDNQGAEFKGKIQINEYTDVNNNENPEILDPTCCNILTDDCDLTTIGSEVCIQNEHFYVIGEDSNNKPKLLAKYNLGVGVGFDTPTNIQNENATGMSMTGPSPYTGTVAFATNPYFSIDNPQYVYTNEKENGVYKASIAEYVENYVTYLSSYNINVSGTLMSFDDFENLGCTSSTNTPSCSRSNVSEWVYNVSYWTGQSVNSATNPAVYGVYFAPGFIPNGADNSSYFGVRPVIILEGSSSNN